MAPRGSKPDDPFTDDWNPGTATGEGVEAASDEVPEAAIDPERTDFLKPHHVARKPQGFCELVSVSGATEYSDIILHLKLGSRMFRLGLKNFDRSFVALRKKFGAKKADWHGKLEYRVMPHKGKPDGFVAVRPA